jgi:hypothetical protein
LELNRLSPKVLQRLEQSREVALSKQKKSSKVSNAVSSGYSLFNLESSINWIGMIVVTMVALYYVIDWQQMARINDLG